MIRALHFQEVFPGALGLKSYKTITTCFTSQYLEFQLEEVSDIEGFKVINSLKEEAIVVRKNALKMSLMKILKGIENEIKSDFRNVETVVDCDSVSILESDTCAM